MWAAQYTQRARRVKLASRPGKFQRAFPRLRRLAFR